jgi:hypothetical protein
MTRDWSPSGQKRAPDNERDLVRLLQEALEEAENFSENTVPEFKTPFFLLFFSLKISREERVDQLGVLEDGFHRRKRCRTKGFHSSMTLDGAVIDSSQSALDSLGGSKVSLRTLRAVFSQIRQPADLTVS